MPELVVPTRTWNQCCPVWRVGQRRPMVWVNCQSQDTSHTAPLASQESTAYCRCALYLEIYFLVQITECFQSSIDSIGRTL